MSCSPGRVPALAKWCHYVLVFKRVFKADDMFRRAGTGGRKGKCGERQKTVALVGSFNGLESACPSRSEGVVGVGRRVGWVK